MYAVHHFSFWSLMTVVAPFLPSVLSTLTNETASKTVVFPIPGRQVAYTTPLIEYYVNGSNIPDVDLDIGESYAGLLPISQLANETRQLYFWYFPSSNPLAKNEITISLNGGPGDSSLKACYKKMDRSYGNLGLSSPCR